MTTPELLCPDRRDRVLTLYFSTALTRGQYVFGKVLAAIVPLLVLTLVPMWFLYAGNVLFAVHPVGYVQDHAADALRITVGGIALAAWFGLVGLAVASLTGRRAFAVGGYLALITVPTIIGGSLASATGTIQARAARLPRGAAQPGRGAVSRLPGATSRPPGGSATTSWSWRPAWRC